MLRKIVIALSVVPVVSLAADKWVPVTPDNPPMGATFLNVGHVVLNDYGNRVATLRVSTNGGYRMDILTEFDCRAHRQRALSSATTDKDGRLIAASGADKTWFTGDDAVGLAAACSAPLVKP